MFVPIPAELLKDCERPPFPENYTIATSMDYVAALIRVIDDCNERVREIRALQPQPGLFDGFDLDAF